MTLDNNAFTISLVNFSTNSSALRSGKSVSDVATNVPNASNLSAGVRTRANRPLLFKFDESQSLFNGVLQLCDADMWRPPILPARLLLPLPISIGDFERFLFNELIFRSDILPADRLETNKKTNGNRIIRLCFGC